MSNRETLDYDPIDALIEQGRREIADGRVEKAQWCFEEVLRRRPDEPRALLGLSYAKRKSESEAPPPSGAASSGDTAEDTAVEKASSDDTPRDDTSGDTSNEEDAPDTDSVPSADVEVVVLVREKRYGEALVKLRAELANRPDDAALLRSIAHLEQHIGRPSARPLTRLPSASPAAPDQLTPKMRAPVAVPKPKPSAPRSKTPSSPVPSPLSPLSTRPTPAVEVDLSVTQPFELMRVADTRRQSAEKAVQDAKPTIEQSAPASSPAKARDRESEPEREPRLSSPAPELTASGEVRLADLSASGGISLADEDPSGPALGSLPPAPMPADSGGASSMFWLITLVAIAAAALFWVLRG